MAEEHWIEVDRLNQFLVWAIDGVEPGPMTEYEAEVFAEMKADVEAEPDVVWMPVFDS